MFEESVVDSPNVVMQVYGRGGEAVKSAQVGDPLELHFEIIDPESPYEIFVRDLVAKDGNDQSEIILIDSRGCPAEGQIMGPLVKNNENGKVLLSNFDAFKFPTSEVVQFRAHVTPCMPTCEPVDCTYNDYYGSGQQSLVSSYGRKKRALSQSDGERVLVTNSVVIMDKFQQNQGPKAEQDIPMTSTRVIEDKKPNYYRKSDLKQATKVPLPWTVQDMKSSPEFMNFNNDYQKRPAVEAHITEDEELDHDKDGLCFDATGIVVAIVSFLVLQIVIAVVWTQLVQKRKKSNQDKDDYIKQMFNPYAIRTS